jgi:hypothetical protein
MGNSRVEIDLLMGMFVKIFQIELWKLLNVESPNRRYAIRIK